MTSQGHGLGAGLSNKKAESLVYSLFENLPGQIIVDQPKIIEIKDKNLKVKRT